MVYRFAILILLTSLIGLLNCQPSQPYSLSIGVPLPIPPLPPSAKTFSSITTDAYITPFVLLGEGAKDRSSLGLKKFQSAIGTSRCASDVQDWNDLNSSPVLEGFNLFRQDPFTLGSTYYISIRSYDNFEQPGEPFCLDGFVYSDQGWKNSAYVKPTNANAFMYLGISVSIDGDTMVVGAPGENSDSRVVTNGSTTPPDINRPGSGAAYVFRNVDGLWVQEAHLKASNADAGDRFGFRTAISGDTIAVAADLEASTQFTITNGASASADNSLAKAGAVYIFRRTAGTWAQEAYIKSFNSFTTVGFGGTGVALSNDTLAVGGFADPTDISSVVNGIPGSFNHDSLASGAVFVYKRTGVNWAAEAYLKASNNSAGSLFGSAVSIDGDTIAVGSTKESSNYAGIINGPSASTDRSATNAGAVYIFTRSGGLWSQTAYLKSNINYPNSEFGTSLSLKGNRLAVGVPKESGKGSVYVFRNSGGVWSQEAKIQASNQQDGDLFGASVAVDGNLLVVGAPNESSCIYTIENSTTSPDYGSRCVEGGAAYIYNNSSGSWTQEAFAKASNLWPGENNPLYGDSVSISSGRVAIGGWKDNGYQFNISNPGEQSSIDFRLRNSGAVYVLDK